MRRIIPPPPPIKEYDYDISVVFNGFEGIAELREKLNNGWVIHDKTEGNQYHPTFFILKKLKDEIQPKQ